MRQLRSELVHTMSEHALEILGIDGRQSDYRQGRINKETNPGFLHLWDQNRFLGTGDKYLRSDQIVRVSGFLYPRLDLASDIQIGTSPCSCWSRVN